MTETGMHYASTKHTTHKQLKRLSDTASAPFTSTRQSPAPARPTPGSPRGQAPLQGTGARPATPRNPACPPQSHWHGVSYRSAGETENLFSPRHRSLSAASLY